MPKISALDIVVMALAIIVALASLEVIVFVLGGRSYKHHGTSRTHGEAPGDHAENARARAGTSVGHVAQNQSYGADHQFHRVSARLTDLGASARLTDLGERVGEDEPQRS